MSESDSPLSSNPLNTLDSYIATFRPLQAPQAIAISAEIRDRGSLFVAHIFSATTPEQAKSQTKHVKYVLHANRKATHEIAAWRCMVVKPGCTGLGGLDEFELAAGSLDDGERWGGDRVLKVMQRLAVIDAVVVVSRWYGGTLLGPSRFDHIETCTAEVCRAFKRSEELRESITTLETLDVLLEGLREELRTLQRDTSQSSANSEPSSFPSSLEKGNPRDDTAEQAEKKKADYSSIDLPKARRLIKARENAMKWVKDSLHELRNSRSAK